MARRRSQPRRDPPPGIEAGTVEPAAGPGRRTSMWWRGGRVAPVLAVACVAMLAAACGSAAGGSEPAGSARPLRVPVVPVPGGGGQPARFVSLRFAPRRLQGSGPLGFMEVALSNATTGAIIRRLLPASRDGMGVTGLAVDRSGNLWITYSKGPASRSDVAGGDPALGSCGNEIVTMHAGTGRTSTFLRTPDNVLISGAVPSPDGRLLAYRESGCATGYFNSYLRVTQLSTGRSWTIGAGLPRCHVITDPSWSTSGRALLAGYAPAASRSYHGPQGTCSVSRRERLVRLSPTQPQPGMNGSGATADPGCQITSVAGTAGGGMLAIEACGGQLYLAGPARLLVFSPRLRQLRRITLGRCTDGNELASDASGRSVLVSAYLYCNPPGKPGPVTRLWRYRAGHLHVVTTVPGDTSGVSLMTW